jgi:hypothetical protein
MSEINYHCKCCDYVTRRTNDLAKHKLTKKHLINEEAYLEQSRKQQLEKNVKKKKIKKCSDEVSCEFQCEICKKEFKHRQSLTRHLNNKCKKSNNDEKSNVVNDTDKITILISEYNELKNEKKKLLDLATINATANMINAKSAKKSMSMMGYAMMHLKNAPPIKLLESKEAIKLLTYDKKTKHSLNELLMYHYEQNSLPKFIGDMIVVGYKKDNAEEQSIWVTDNSRLTFIVMELLESGKREWEFDKSGQTIKKLIIIPLLEEIKIELTKFIKKLGDMGKNEDNAMEYMENMYRSKKIICDITKGILTNAIIKYISPYFGFDSKLNCTNCKQKTSTDNIEIMMDEFYCRSCAKKLLKKI